MNTENKQNVLRVALVQSDIAWEDKKTNLEKAEHSLSVLSGDCDLAIFPEMFSTGFSMNSRNLAEPKNGETIASVKKWAKQYHMAICGSFIAVENEQYYNRGFFVTPQGECFFYDKRHLFRMSNEDKHFDSGNEKLIIHYNGWNICLLICYDLRFPVWSRNIHNEYDLLIYCANWPQSRIFAWDTLLAARAIENASYVCGVNRVGTTTDNIVYTGHSAVYDMKGQSMLLLKDVEETSVIELDLNYLHRFREKFPVWRDADSFSII